MTSNRVTRIPLLSLAIVSVMLGCDQVKTYLYNNDAASTPSSPAAAESRPRLTEIIAQGTLQPLGGVLAIMAPPGDRVAEVLVEVGQSVEVGQPLILLESATARKIEVDVAEMQISEAEARIAAERAAAQAKLKVAEISLRQAETQLEQARNRMELASAPGGSLDLLRQAADLGQRKLQQLRDASNNPSTTRLVSDNSLDEEQLKVSETRVQYEEAKTQASEAVQTGELAVEVARQEIEAAKYAMAAVQADNPIESLKQQIELLRLKAAASRLIAPMNAEVLSVDAMVGAATGTSAMVQLANVKEMVCVAEVNVADLPRVKPGQPAIIRSPGLAKPLAGIVQRIQPIIAPPALANPFPMAPVDRHTAEVTIKIDDSDAEAAADLIQLQVEVTIQTDQSTVAQSEPVVYR